MNLLWLYSSSQENLCLKNNMCPSSCTLLGSKLSFQYFPTNLRESRIHRNDNNFAHHCFGTPLHCYSAHLLNQEQKTSNIAQKYCF